MPPSPPKPTLHLLPPPNPSVLNLTIRGPAQFTVPEDTQSSIPQRFLDALHIRVQVFILEQECPIEMEIDTDDPISWHWIIYGPESKDDNGKQIPAATIRLIPAHVYGAPSAPIPGFEEPNYEKSTMWDQREPYVTIGRLATLGAFRGRGYARMLMEEALRFAGGHGGEMVLERNREGMGEWRGLVLVHAQARLEEWYRGLGFEGDEGMGRWAEGGIEHLGMWRRVDVSGRERISGISGWGAANAE